MSLPATTFYCSRCNFNDGDVGTWGMKEYVLPNNVRIVVNRSLGWCDDCEGVVSVELFSEEACLRDIQQAEQSLTASGQRPRRIWWQLHRFIFHRAWQGYVTNWERRHFRLTCDLDDAKDSLTHLRQRLNPPRCLACGSKKIRAPLVANAEAWENMEQPKPIGFIHPGCGGELWMYQDGLRIGLRPSVSYYTPEGDLIDNEEVDGYTTASSEYFEERDKANAIGRGREVPVEDVM